MISQRTIDEIYNTARVEEVIGDFVQLKKAGSNFKGLSPFVDEKTPSFMVSPSKQIWKDFSSGKGGNVVKFMMEYEQYSYPDALRYLAKKYSIEIEETQQSDEQKQAQTEREALYKLTEFAQSYFSQNLLESDEGMAIGYSYFKERGYTSEIIQKFGLGYSSKDWDALYKYCKKNQYSDELLEKSGLFIYREDKNPIDRFKDRVIFPIYSFSGRILGFAGRILDNNKKVAKYLNSPETDIYHKSKVLYGLYMAKKEITKNDRCYLVEGYTDVISMHQKGLKNIVASSGTALTEDQIRLIKRLTNNITILFDGDAAGIKAAMRGVDLILQQGINVKICLFPEGEDPDSFAKSHSLAEINDFLSEKEQDFIQFKAQLLYNETQNDPIAKANAIGQIVETIALVDSPVKREIFLQECSKVMDIEISVLQSELARVFAKKQNAQRQKSNREQSVIQPVQKVEDKAKKEVLEKPELHYLELEIARLLLKHAWEEVYIKFLPDGEEKFVHYPSVVIEEVTDELMSDDVQIEHPQVNYIVDEFIKAHVRKEPIDLHYFMKGEDMELQEFITNLITEKHALHERWKEKGGMASEDLELRKLSNYVRDTLLRFKERFIFYKIKEIGQQEELQEDEIYQIMAYLELKQKLSAALKRVV